MRLRRATYSFVQRSIEGEFETRAPFLSHNLRLIRQIRELEHKTRRLDVLVDDELIFAFYERLIPPGVSTGVDFERWRIDAERNDPKLLFLSRDEVMRHRGSRHHDRSFSEADGVARPG